MIICKQGFAQVTPGLVALHRIQILSIQREASRKGYRVRGGTAPRQPHSGTHGVWPRGVCWLPTGTS